MPGTSNFTARVRYRSATEGGRSAPMKGDYRVLFERNGCYVTCQVSISKTEYSENCPGVTYLLPISLWVEPDGPPLRPGDTFFLSEGQKRIADGEVLEIVWS